MKVLYLSCPAKINIGNSLKKNLTKLKKFSKIAIVTTAQFLSQLERAKKILKKNNLKVLIGKPKFTALKPGQILGCDISTGLAVEKEADCFLYIGTGKFHPLGLAKYIEKPVFILDPYSEKLTEVSQEEKNEILKQKIQRLSKLKDAKNIGILVSIKSGQYMLQEDALNLKKELEKQNKKVFLFLCDTITNLELENFTFIDVWINTACPRIVEDYFGKPMINAFDLGKNL